MLSSTCVSEGKHPLVGLQIRPNRPDATIGEVREVDGDLLLTIRWDSVPAKRDGRVLGMTRVATTWLRCTERDPKLVRRLVRKWLFEYHQCTDRRISDVEPPADVPCGGWLAPDGVHWRGSECTHPILAWRIVRQLGWQLGPHDAERWLETHGWMQVLDDGTAGPHHDSMTQAQRDALFDLAVRFPTMRGRIMSLLGRSGDHGQAEMSILRGLRREELPLRR